MSDMVEKVKAALIAEDEATGSERHLKYWDDLARAAIKALREPTEEMLKAGTDAVDDGETYGCRAKAEGAYYDMLHAALSAKRG